MDKIYPRNKCVCDTDEHWIGRNLLRTALLKEGQSRTYTNHQQKVWAVVTPDIPLYWTIDTPEISGRKGFSRDVAERGASPVRAFLAANGVAVKDEAPPPPRAWGDRALVRVFSANSSVISGASEAPTLVMLPEMRRAVWNLVRYNEDEPAF